MKYLFSIGFLVIAYSCVIFGYNEFAIGNQEVDKCQTCTYFMKSFNPDLRADEVEEVYREFYELAKINQEDVCSNFCVMDELDEPQILEVATSKESSENLNENLIAHVGCATCLHIVENVTKHVRYYGFRHIIQGFKYACFNDVTFVCKSFLTHHEDELIDAIYHFKNHSLPVCKSIHQC